MDSTQVAAITASVDFASIVTGVAAIATAVCLVVIAIKGGRMLVGALRGA